MGGLAGGVGVGSGTGSSTPLVQYGSLELRPHLVYNGSYNDGLLVRPGVANNTYIDAFSPGMLVNIGQHWSVDYTPTYTQYSNGGYRDTLTHVVSANGSLSIRDYALALTQSYASASTPLIETGRQTDTEKATTNLSVTHPLTQTIMLQGNVQQGFTFVSNSPDFSEWSAQGGLQYQVTQHISIAASIRSGFNAIYKSPDSAYVQPGAQVQWTASTKVSLSASVGLDDRVVVGRHWRWTETPIYTGNADYNPFTYTHVQGSVRRTIAPSLVGGQSADITAASGTAEQRLLGHFWVNGGVDFQFSKYLTTGLTRGIRRNDYAWTYRGGIRTTFLQRGMIAVTYQQTDNDSSVRLLSQKTRRIGCEVAYRY